MPGAIVVDDSPAQAHSIAALLLGAGYDPVETAADWPGCKAALARLDPALVVLDVVMAPMSGDVMAAQLRRQPSLAGTRIVLYSKLGARDLQALATRAGADGFELKGRAQQLVQLCVRLAPP